MGPAGVIGTGLGISGTGTVIGGTSVSNPSSVGGGGVVAGVGSSIQQSDGSNTGSDENGVASPDGSTGNGMVYVDYDRKTGEVRRFSQTCLEDKLIKKFLEKQVGKRNYYGPYTCRDFSCDIFDFASDFIIQGRKSSE